MVTVSVAQLQVYAAAAAAAIASGSYDVAIQQAAAGLAIAGGLPTAQDSGASASWESAVGALKQALAEARRLRDEARVASLSHIQRTAIRYKRVSS